MTLVIAGYSKGVLENGVYFAADSHISQNNNILVKGFKKVIELPIRVKGLNFCGEYFHSYAENNYESSCAIAFAGSSLVAQHIINSMKNHLSELYPIYRDGRYQIAMPCEKEVHLKANGIYSDDMFLEKDLDGILTGEYLSKVVCHSIEAVLKEAKKHGSMKKLFVAYQAEFIFGVQCEKTKKHMLYQYEIVPDDNLGAKVEFRQIKINELAVIGEKIKFRANALNALNNCAPTVKPSEAIFTFLNNSIDSENSIGNFGIGRPSALYNLDGRQLKIIGRKN
ncbi:hypothetical protein [Tatumella saanichensis]|uniref:hypothetical protein n=1 Tax=Tatumella saanichensis TaxID=480813 RepID=UPI0004A2F6D7|nr:hypothetical protein [Tatumella saanichensis]